MGSKLSDSLSQFVTNKSSFSDPYAEKTEHSTPNISEFMNMQKDNKKKKEKHKKSMEERLASLADQIDSFQDTEDDLIDDFEGYLEEYMLDDEDEDFRRNLVRYGRKYARNTAQSGESSEIQKAYAEAETALNKLIDEVAVDKDALQKDITQMRMARSRNYKAFSELIEAKTSLHTTHLNAIKEINNITKTKFDLQMKADKSKQENNEDDGVSSRMIQDLFGVGRKNLIGSYEDVAGGIDSEDGEDPHLDHSGFTSESFAPDFSDQNNENESDGDIFLRYEGRFDHYALEYDENGPVQAYAVDIDGEVIPDYPMRPIADLEFTISENTGTAVDNLSQNYTLIKV